MPCPARRSHRVRLQLEPDGLAHPVGRDSQESARDWTRTRPRPCVPSSASGTCSRGLRATKSLTSTRSPRGPTVAVSTASSSVWISALVTSSLVSNSAISDRPGLPSAVTVPATPCAPRAPPAGPRVRVCASVEAAAPVPWRCRPCPPPLSPRRAPIAMGPLPRACLFMTPACTPVSGSLLLEHVHGDPCPRRERGSHVEWLTTGCSAMRTACPAGRRFRARCRPARRTAGVRSMRPGWDGRGVSCGVP